MLIAREKEKENIVEYILYMWQMEDLVRGNELRLEKVMAQVFPSGGQSPERSEYANWFAKLIDEMNRDGLEKKGHVESVRKYMKSLENLHHTLLTIYQDQSYHAVYNESAVHLAELRKKNAAQNLPEIEVGLVGLYGYLLLKMSKAGVSEETQKAMKAIGRHMAFLAESFKKLQRGELKLPAQLNN